MLGSLRCIDLKSRMFILICRHVHFPIKIFFLSETQTFCSKDVHNNTQRIINLPTNNIYLSALYDNIPNVAFNYIFIDLINKQLIAAQNGEKIFSDKWFEFNIKEMLNKILLTIFYEPFQFTKPSQ